MTRKVLPPTLLFLGAGMLLFFLVSGLTREPVQGVPDFTPTDVTFTLAFAMFLPMGAFIATRRPDSPIGWIACGIGFTEVLSSAAYEYATRALLLDPEGLPFGPEMAWMSGWTWSPGFALITFLMLLFPTGALPGPSWRWVGWLAVLTTGLLTVWLMTLWPERGAALLGEDPPTALVPAAVVEATVWLLFLSIVCAFASVIVRFRRSFGIERQQLKWMAYVAGIGAALVASSTVLEWVGADDTGFGITVEHLLNLSAVGVPIATAIAVLRYRLYDIDLIINRTLVYGVLTAVLAGTYAGLVFLLQRALSPVTPESDLAIAASTLSVAALFRPARARIQQFIDRRFYRRKFDAQQTLEGFSRRVRDEVDLQALTEQLLAVVNETMRAEHVSLWIRSRETSR